MAGAVAAGHAAVGGVDDGVAFQRRDVPLPEIEIAFHRRQIVQAGNAFLCNGFFQIRVLYGEKLLADLTGHAHVHQAAQQLPLLLRSRGDVVAAIARRFVQQLPDEKLPLF